MPDFELLAGELRQRIATHYEQRGERLEGTAGLTTLETNSGLVPRRAAPLVRILEEQRDRGSLAGASLVDLGCGFGALSLYFANLGASVTGIDVHEERLLVPTEIAGERDLPAAFRRAEMQSLPFDDDSFDLAIMNNSLCYVVEPAARQAALSEARRVLRPGGHLLIRNPNRWSPIDPFTSLPLVGALPGKLPGRVAASLGIARSNVRLVSVRAARAELRKAGFERVVEVALPGRRRPRPVRLVARYQHLLAVSPDG